MLPALWLGSQPPCSEMIGVLRSQRSCRRRCSTTAGSPGLDEPLPVNQRRRRELAQGHGVGPNPLETQPVIVVPTSDPAPGPAGNVDAGQGGLCGHHQGPLGLIQIGRHPENLGEHERVAQRLFHVDRQIDGVLDHRHVGVEVAGVESSSRPGPLGDRPRHSSSVR